MWRKRVYKVTNEQIEETYKQLLPYLKHESTTNELREMCCNCDEFKDSSHDFTKCKYKPCFKFWLAFKYLEWVNSYER